MKLFNAYTKVMRRHLPTIIVYMLVLYAIIMVMIFQVKTSNSYEDDRITVLFINADVENEFMESFRHYLAERVNLVEGEQYEGTMESVLFYQMADYVLEIPEGFYAELIQKEDSREAHLYKYTAASSYAQAFVDKTIEDYCNYWLSFRSVYRELSEREIGQKIQSIMDKQGEVTYYNRLLISESKKNLYYFFNYASYSIMGIITIGVVTALFFLNKSVIYTRTCIAPISQGQLDMELLFCNLLYAILVWGLHILIAMLMFSESFFSWTGFFMCMNSFALAMATLGMSYLILQFVNVQNVIGIFSNLLIFGMCFMGGTFIPQYLLDETIRGIAVFMPVSWYIQANDLVNETGMLTLADVLLLLKTIGIQYAFFAMFYCFSLFVKKQKEEV